jgi:hypothetical protein
LGMVMVKIDLTILTIEGQFWPNGKNRDHRIPLPLITAIFSLPFIVW